MSGVLSDYVRDMFVDLTAEPSGWENGDALAHHVEQAVLRGSVRVEDGDAGPPSVHYRPVRWEEDLPLTRTASMVTEIIPLVLYLRHKARPGSTLIIEEPEAHMHPAMQVQLTTELARIVAAGIRVIVTVHSDWILSALANICRMSDLSDDQRSDLEAGDISLPASQVGVWEFLPSETGGTETRELRLDSDNGMYDAGYPAVAETLYDDWATIDSRLQGD
ncbi:AAA family ATPase [Candidatus Palauibacter sp.]|uniref:AAA family ATPase n=1 Tax=Candidatus Palauibacter sp. TaxID=3101350 RepID=UPI003C705704